MNRLLVLTAAGALSACAPPEPVIQPVPDVPMVTIIPIVEPPSAAVTVPASQASPRANAIPGTLNEICEDPFANGAEYCLG
ncbi:MAG: hypothetical protein ACU0BS_13040 [Hasllibacter sp.]